ncbi:MAG: hypothetical protein KDA27_04450 [Candidatus Eisenbacteria bacterium]|uniref:PTS EIIA type-4 domain-containing protein n=1 Tax=Eiseniibacteriota bacterium TaxID=2212470 RepID=A0A956SC69_UNCEI|nr:hypothetical protein [Candidatus Eisenbacteria bacterium]MCB9462549.1 hypothetical protein [Candidatus Eisenbacteria bacterium]
MIRAVLLTHGMLGTELVRAAGKIYGTPDGVSALTNEGMSIESLVAKLREELGVGAEPDSDEGRRSGAEPGVAGEPVFLFVDLIGGSCCHAGLALREFDPRIRIVGGVNLPMLLEFLHHRDRVGPEELLERVVSRGRDGVRVP